MNSMRLIRAGRRTVLPIFATAMLAATPLAQAVLLGSESFENPNGSAEAYAGNPYLGSFFLDGASDNFVLRDISADTTPLGWDDVLGNPSGPISGQDGNWAIVAEDVNDAGNPLGTFSVIRLDNIDVSSHSNLTVTVRLGTHVAWNSAWEPTDHIRIEYAKDLANPIGIPANTLSSSGYSVAGAFYGTGGTRGVNDGGFSDGPARDDNENGQFDVGENTLIPSDGSMQDFTFTIPGTANDLSIQIVVDDTAGSEELVIDYIRVNGDLAVTDPPVLAGIEGAPAAYNEGGSAVQITNTLMVTDSDSNIASASVRIVNHLGAEDLLTVNGALPGGIVEAPYNNLTGILALSGSATPADYQTALRQIEYSNTSGNPNGFIQRTVRFGVNDGTDPSNTLERGVIVMPTVAGPLGIPHTENFDTDGDGVRYTSNSFNEANADYFERTDSNPHPGHAGGTYTFTPPQGAGHFAAEDVNAANNPLGVGQPGIVRLADLNSNGLGSLAVEVYLADLDNGTTFDGGEMIEVQVAFDGAAGGTNLSSGSYTTIGRFVADGTMNAALRLDSNLDGSSTDPADAASPTLNSTFTPYSFDILGSGTLLSVQVVVTDTSGNEEIAFDHITVSGVVAGDPPVLAAIEAGPASYTEGGSATQVTNTITVTDADDTDLEGGTIQLTTGYLQSEDILGVNGALPGGITAAPFDPIQGEIVLSGTSSLANYQAALRQITYANTAGANPNICDRTVVFQVTDGTTNSVFQSRVIEVNGVVAPVAGLPYLEDFDTDGDGVRYTSNTINDPQATPQDYFERTDDNPHPGNLAVPHVFTPPQGGGYWTSEDVEHAGNKLATHGIVRLPDLDLNGFSTRTVSIFLAETGAALEAGDQIEIQYAYDGNGGGTKLTNGSYTSVGRFINNGGNLRQDTDLDGSSSDPEDVASPELDPTMTQYTFTLPDAGNVLSLQVKVTQDGGSENISFDHIQIDAAPVGPEIEVQGQGMEIVSGDLTPDSADDTDFGTIECNVDPDPTHTFTILNTGGPDLNLTGAPVIAISGAGAAAFSASIPALTTIPSPSNTTFMITFSAPGTGTFDATVSIDNDDANEDPYTFAITGTNTDTTPPLITLSGDNPLVLECGVDTFSEPGFSASDICDGNLTGSVVVAGDTVDEGTVGTYNITYNVADAAGNPATQVTRQVDVVDTLPPVFTAIKDRVYTVPAGGTADATAHLAGLSATDICDGPVAHTCGVLPGPSPLPAGNLFVVGVHPIECTAQDGEGNVATTNFNIVVLEIQLTPFEDRMFDVVSLRGDAAAGASGTILGIGRAYLNNSNEIVYSAVLAGAGLNNSGVFQGPLAGPHPAIAVKNTASGAGNFGNFSEVALNDSGHASFQSLIGSNAGQFADTGGGPALAALRSGIAPSTGGALYNVLQKPALTSGGQLFTSANLQLGSGAPAVTALEDTIITSSAGSVVAREGDPSSLPTTDYGHFQPRVVASENNNHFAFSSFLSEAVFDPSDNTALFTGTVGGGAPTVALREGDAAPGVGGATFSQFLGEAVNSSGEIAARINLALGGGVSAANNEGLWSNSSGGLTLIAREGDVAPCLPTTLVAFSRFSKFYIGDDGSVCFHAFLKNATATPAVNSANDGSLWRWRAGQLHLIAREGDFGNNTDAGVIRHITAFDCSGTGGITYAVTYLPGLGDTVTSNNIGVYLDKGAADAVPELILRRNDSFDLAGVSHTVVGITLSTESNVGGGTGGYGRAINDSGNVLLNLTLSGSQSGIFVLSP